MMNRSDLFETMKAERKDFIPIRALLDACNLPFDDIRSDDLGDYFIARNRHQIIGVIGLEPYAPYGLLRSLAVEEEYQGKGLGSTLVAKLEEHARSTGVAELYLLTTTAASFFRDHGYVVTDRDGAPDTITSTGEFAMICPESAKLMKKVL